MSTPDDSELIAVENCRGILGCTLDEAGNVCLDHQVTCKQFSFALKDLDEVIDTLVDFRAAIKAGQVTGISNVRSHRTDIVAAKQPEPLLGSVGHNST